MASLSINDFPNLFMRVGEWAERYPVTEEPEEFERPLCILINNLKHRNVEHEILRRAFQYSDYEVMCFSDLSVCTVLGMAKVASLKADRDRELIFYVISDGQCGVLADLCHKKLEISEILDVFNLERRNWFKREIFVFDSNQLLTKEFDENGEEIPSEHEKQLRFLRSEKRVNQHIILGKKPGEILTFRTINEVKMTSLSWAFTYYLMANHLQPRDIKDVIADYLTHSPDFGSLWQRRHILPLFT